MKTLLIVLLTCLAACSTLAAGAGRRMNVVFILADDLGGHDLGCYGSTFYRTPNLDRLARSGMMFTQAYAAAPICSPTRGSILTGLWPGRIGITSPVCHQPEEYLEEISLPKAGPQFKAVQARSATRLKLEYDTIAKSLKDAGYVTGHFGKWHLGPEPFDPLHQGFETDVPHYSGPGPAGSYLAPWKFPAKLNFQGQPGEDLEDRMATEAVKFLRENKDRPFFLNYWAFSVHSPWDAKPEVIEKYRKLADPKNPQHNALYAAMIENLDDSVGTLMRTLDELHLADNTIVIFFSDNGGVHWSPTEEGPGSVRLHPDFAGVPITSNAPFRGGKGTIYEGGTREPCAIVWPGVTRPGQRSDAVIQSIDFYPTLLDMLGLPPRGGQKFDGVSIVPALREKPLSRDAIFCIFPHYAERTGAVPSAYVRKGDWKLIRAFCDNNDQTDRFELYNLANDLGETKNLAAEKPELVRDLNDLLGGFLRDSKTVIPGPNPNYGKTEPPDPLHGWKARNCDATVAGGILSLQGKNANAFLGYGFGKQMGPATVKIRARSATGGNGKIEWLPDNKQESARPVPFQLPAGDWQEVKVEVPTDGPLGILRIYLPAQAQPVQVDWIEIKTGKAPVKRWKF
ncbi:MAG TPA: sulfatase [Tepidisphaeraceae bacterium]|nr:sulfatase [Tepidisphaeraceae bacterium]